MKFGEIRLGYAALLVMATIASPLTAAPSGPEYAGVFVALDGAKAAQVSLERQTPRARTRMRALGLAGGTVEYEMSGETSPVRFKVGRPLNFVVRVESQSKDPQKQIQFFKLVTARNVRRLRMVSVGFLSGGKDRMQDSAVRFDAMKYGSDFFKFSSAQPLENGEYLVTLDGYPDAFLFGIDP